ncbi:MAG: hypothetical protein E6J78_02965 [Deltaproteobacteria bacterium]|nr:MAG: hypothetical protein E6J78_02965 [Deltaproteobacteria bacterium]
MMARLRKLWRSGQRGQAVTETALLMILIFVLGIGVDWLLKSQSRGINFIDIHVRGFYFVLSLPFP